MVCGPAGTRAVAAPRMGTCPRPPGPALRSRPVENYTSRAPPAVPDTRRRTPSPGPSQWPSAPLPPTRGDAGLARHHRRPQGPPPPDTRRRADPDGARGQGESLRAGAHGRGAGRARRGTRRGTRGEGRPRDGDPAGADDEGQEDRGHEREGPEPLGFSRFRACTRRARGGTRTPMIVRSHGPEPCASTNSATRAGSEDDDSRSGPPASNQSDPQSGETRHPPDPSAPPPHPPGHTGYDGPDGSVPPEEPVILGGEEHGVPGQVREGR